MTTKPAEGQNEQSASKQKGTPDQQRAGVSGRLTVTVYNADVGGPPQSIHAGPGEKVGKVVDDALEALGVTPTSGDRLVCLASGSNVRDSAHLHLREYAAGPCEDLVWSYSRDTGGA